MTRLLCQVQGVTDGLTKFGTMLQGNTAVIGWAEFVDLVSSLHEGSSSVLRPDSNTPSYAPSYTPEYVKDLASTPPAGNYSHLWTPAKSFPSSAGQGSPGVSSEERQRAWENQHWVSSSPLEYAGAATPLPQLRRPETRESLLSAQKQVRVSSIFVCWLPDTHIFQRDWQRQMQFPAGQDQDQDQDQGQE